MKTKEEILKDHLNIERLTPIQWDCINLAMEEYAQQQLSTPEQLIPVIEKVFGPGAAKGCAERLRQIQVKGWEPRRDNKYSKGELAEASAAYILPNNRREFSNGIPYPFPWAECYWKPTPDNRIRELEKGIALGMAEIDRLKRKEESK